MNPIRTALAVAAASLITLATVPAQAAIIVSEVAPWSSGSSPFAADWFELTNTGASAVTITGWTMDDDSGNPNSAPLTGIASIGAGESVIFIELASGGNATTLINSFKSTWFGANVPAGLQIGTYTQGAAGGVGLGTGGDQVNIFSGTAGTLQAKVLFGASDSVNPLQTFDNAAGLNNATISTLSVVGTNGAFVAAADVNEIGSPGTISNVPETSTAAMMLAGVLALTIARRQRR